MKKFAGFLILLIVGALLSCPKPTSSPSKAWVVSTFAGSGTRGSENGVGVSAQFSSPTDVALDSSGNLYVTDYGNHRIRKITPKGVVSTFAGGGETPQFSNPYGVAVDSLDNVYVADKGNHRIRKITSGGSVSTLAGGGTEDPRLHFRDGDGTFARFNIPYGVAVDASGKVYVADSSNHRIRKITSGGSVSTLAGSGTIDDRGTKGGAFKDGPGATARFNLPIDVALDSSGNVYVADLQTHRIRKITSEGGRVRVDTLAGSTRGYRDGPGGEALFNYPVGVAVDAAGNVYVADNNHRIRMITPEGVVSTIAGGGNERKGSFRDGVGASGFQLESRRGRPRAGTHTEQRFPSR